MISYMCVFFRLLVILVAAAPLTAQTFTAKVIGITDGDTIKVLHNREVVRVRLHGIDCPESRQAFGTRARQFTGALAFGKVVQVKARDTDRYGRTVAEVVLPDGRALNQEIVKAGFGWWYRRYAPGDGVLERLEREARQARRGLWREANAIAPWEFRGIRSGRRPAVLGR